jgi:hypothetical protein
MRKTIDKLSKASRLIGPEDVRAGQYVTIAEKTWQILCIPDDACAAATAEPRIGHVSGWPDEAGWPLRVVKVCLPYVFAETAAGGHVAVDLRCHRLSRLSKSYGRAVFEATRKPAASPPAAPATTG